ncbi:hypothetical protein KI387_015773, partial [Taxus chinensis]
AYQDELQETMKHNSMQEILVAVEVAEDPELILNLFTHAMNIQDKYVFSSNPSFSTQMPHRGVKIKDESNVSHGEDFNEHRPRKEKNQECSSILNKDQLWGSDEMLNGESAI